MVCQACGSPVAGPGAFCTRCGVQAPPAPMGYGAPAPMVRVQQHVQTLGILWCIYGAYRAVTGILAALVLAGISAHGRFGGWGAPPDFPFMQGAPWMAGLATFVAVFMLISAALAFLVGFSLMTRKPWGRVLAIVMGVLALIKIPVGTALGIYTLWVLAPGPSGAEYDAIADRS
jgi:hypothetical protein